MVYYFTSLYVQYLKECQKYVNHLKVYHNTFRHHFPSHRSPEKSYFIKVPYHFDTHSYKNSHPFSVHLLSFPWIPSLTFWFDLWNFLRYFKKWSDKEDLLNKNTRYIEFSLHTDSLRQETKGGDGWFFTICTFRPFLCLFQKNVYI